MKPFDDLGHAVAAIKPFRVKRYDPGRLPDPGQCVDALILDNDRSDGTPRGRLALSNGASWDHLAYRHEVEALAEKIETMRRGVAVQPVDLAELAREQVALALRQLPNPIAHQVQQVHALPPPSGDVAALQEADRLTANAVLTLSEHVNRLLFENAEIRAELELIKRHAIAEVKMVGAG